VFFFAGGGEGGCFANRPPERRGPYVRHELIADCLRTGRRPSVFQCALLEVLLAFSDRPPQPRGPSAAPTRTVHPVTADRPPGLAQVAKSFDS
jgi:hypothetical protein